LPQLANLFKLEGKFLNNKMQKIKELKRFPKFKEKNR